MSNDNQQGKKISDVDNLSPDNRPQKEVRAHKIFSAQYDDKVECTTPIRKSENPKPSNIILPMENNKKEKE